MKVLNRPVNHFYIIWLMVIVAVGLLSRYYSGVSKTFFGIAESDEHVLNSAVSLRIVDVNVQDGQEVKKGDVLIEAISIDVQSQLSTLRSDKEQITLERFLSRTEKESLIQQYKQERAMRVADLSNDLELLNIEKKSKEELLNSLGENGESQDYSVYESRRNTIQNQIDLTKSLYDERISLLQQSLSGDDDPYKVRIRQIEEQIERLERESDRLVLRSPIDGIIGAIGFGEGEAVSPYASMMSVYGYRPILVKAYIHEGGIGDVALGKTVYVSSVMRDEVVEGEVIGIGSRVMPYPIRLLKNPAVQLYGRQVVISLHPDNPFLVGEKLLINTEKKSKLKWMP